MFLIYCSFSTQAKELKIILYGDSLMSGYGLEKSFHLDQILKEDLLALNIPVEIINASVPGETTKGGLNRIDWSLQDDFDLFVLGLGANDLLRGIDPSVTKVNLEEMILKVKERNIPILLAGMLAPDSYGSNFQSEFNEIFSSLAQKYQLIFYPFLLKDVALQPDLNQDDGKHPNKLGMQVIASNLAKIIKNNYQ